MAELVRSMSMMLRESQEIEDGLAPAIMRMAAEPVEESPLGVMQTELGGQQISLEPILNSGSSSSDSSAIDDADFVLLESSATDSTSAAKAPRAVKDLTIDKLIKLFELPSTTKLLSEFDCCYFFGVLLPGKLVVTTSHLCFCALVKQRREATMSDNLNVKRGRSWARRWFALSRTELVEYTQADSGARYHPNASIPVAAIATIVPIDDPERPFMFKVITDKKEEHLFAADSKMQRQDWVEALRLGALIARKADSQLLKISIALADVGSVDKLSVDNTAQLLPNAISIREANVAPHVFTSLRDPTAAIASIKEAKEIDDRASAAARERKLTATPASSTAALHSLKKQGDKEFAQVEAVWRSKFKITKEGEVLLAYVGCSYASHYMLLFPGCLYISALALSFLAETGPLRRQIYIPWTEITKITKANTAKVLPVAIQVNTLDKDFTFTFSNIISTSREDVYQALHAQWQLSRSNTLTASNSSPAGGRLELSPRPSRRGSQRGPSDSDQPAAVLSYGASNAAFHQLFPSIPLTEHLVGDFTCNLSTGTANNVGRMFISMRHLCYHDSSIITSGTTLLKIPLEQIESVSKSNSFYGMLPTEVEVILKDGRKYIFGRMLSRERAFGTLQYWLNNAKQKSRDPPEDDAAAVKRLGVEYQHSHNQDFHAIFGHAEDLIEDFSCAYGVTPGRLYLSPSYLSWYTYGRKVVIPFSQLAAIRKERSLLLLNNAITIETKDHREFCFVGFIRRDAAHDTICAAWKQSQAMDLIRSDSEFAPFAVSDSVQLSAVVPVKRLSPKRITIVTIGSRGDVQPFIAFALALERSGHKVRLATHETFRSFVTGHGLEFFPMGGDPKELMELCVKNDMFTPKFMKEALGSFRGFVNELFTGTWAASQGADALIATPSSLAGYHVAEARKIPFFAAFTMPFTRTRAYPNPFAVPSVPLGGQYNWATHVFMEQMLWLPVRDQINKLRKDVMGLPPAGMTESAQSFLYTRRVPHLYCFSSAVVPKPPDWAEEIHLTGYWFLDNSQTGWTPSAELLAFLKEGPPPVYIGFGSITIEDPMALSKLVSDALARAGLRAILTKGWGGLGDNVAFGKHVFLLPSVPHDWLFPQVSAVVHHGGAGTLAAGLRAGKPTIVVSFFGDQFFWGQRVEELGAGLHVPFKKLTLDTLSEALKRVTSEQPIRDAAGEIGKKINAEDGCENAVSAFHRHFDTAYVPPTFLPDAEFSNCCACNAAFGLVATTRHHCRNCGKLFCGNCSKTYMPLEHFSYFDPVRVCDACAASVRQRKPSATSNNPPSPRNVGALQASVKGRSASPQATTSPNPNPNPNPPPPHP